MRSTRRRMTTSTEIVGLPNNRTVEDEALRMFAPAADTAAAPAKESADEERARYSGYTRAEYEKLLPEARMRIHAENNPAPEKKPSGGLPQGMTREQFEKLDPMSKLAAANEARAQREGWDYSGFNRDR